MAAHKREELLDCSQRLDSFVSRAFAGAEFKGQFLVANYFHQMT